MAAASPQTPRLASVDPRSSDAAPPPLPLWQHAALTLGIVCVALVLALTIPSITVVWSIVGSSVSMLVAFVIPAASYLRIRRSKGWTARRAGAWALLAISAPLCVLCTVQAALVHSAT